MRVLLLVTLAAATAAAQDTGECVEADCPTGAECGVTGGEAKVPCPCDESEPDCDCSELPDGSPTWGCSAAACEADADCGHAHLRCIQGPDTVHVSKDGGKEVFEGDKSCGHMGGAECDTSCVEGFQCVDGTCYGTITPCETSAECPADWSCEAVVQPGYDYIACIWPPSEEPPLQCAPIEEKLCVPHGFEVFGNGGVALMPKETYDAMSEQYGWEDSGPASTSPRSGSTPIRSDPEKETGGGGASSGCGPTAPAGHFPGALLGVALLLLAARVRRWQA